MFSQVAWVGFYRQSDNYCIICQELQSNLAARSKNDLTMRTSIVEIEIKHVGGPVIGSLQINCWRK